jgi:hypothetical protein
MIAVEVIHRILIVVNEYEIISLRLLLHRLLVEDLERRVSAASLVPRALIFGRHLQVVAVDVDGSGRSPDEVLFFLLFLFLGLVRNPQG